MKVIVVLHDDDTIFVVKTSSVATAKKKVKKYFARAKDYYGEISVDEFEYKESTLI